MEHFKLKRQSTSDSFGAKKPFEKSRSEESRSSIHESKLSTITTASFPFKKNQILLAKPAIDSNYTVVSSLDDVTEVRQVASSIVHELTSEFVEDKLEKDDGFLEFLLSRLIEPDLKEIIDLAFQQFPSVFDPQGQERLIILTAKSGQGEVLTYLYDKWSDQINFLTITDAGDNTLLHTAVVNCNAETFKVILDKANEMISFHNTIVAEKGEELKSKKPISFAQQEGFDLSTYLDTVNDTGHTAIHLAVNSTFLQGIEELLQKGADVTIPNNENNTILHSAAIDNRAKSLRKLSETLRVISKEGNFTWKQELQRKNGISYIPVMLATDKATIKVLLEHSNLEEPVHDEHGSLLHWATANNRTNLVTLLLEHENIELDQENEKGLTPLCIASRWGYKLITEGLSKAGAKPNHICATGLTAMNYACQYGHSEVVEFLLQVGADLNSDEMEYSALHSAINGGQIEISKYLLDVHHIDPNLYKSKGTPLYEAIKEGRTPCVKLLLTHGANPQLSLDVQGFRPLHAAIKNNQRRAVKLLLESGAGADETMHGGVTPAILAVENDQANILSLLMKEGISITRIDDLGRIIVANVGK